MGSTMFRAGVDNLSGYPNPQPCLDELREQLAICPR